MATANHKHSTMKQNGGKKRPTAAIMGITALAMLPAVVASAYVYGGGVLLQVAIAIIAAVIAELLCLHWRGKPLTTVKDNSAIIAGMIIGIAMPPLAPWYAGGFAAFVGITLAKHCYGGLGNNIFNPAMAGYALAFVSFPDVFDNWDNDASLTQTFHSVFGAMDAVGSPTPLIAASLPEYQTNIDGINPLTTLQPAACIIGGMVLLILRIADWRLTFGFILGALFVAAFYDDITILMHGGLIFAAFFVITDPATAAAGKHARLLYALFAGALALWLRKTGMHTDAIAFAILAANMTAPLFDKLCQRFNHARRY